MLGDAQALVGPVGVGDDVAERLIAAVPLPAAEPLAPALTLGVLVSESAKSVPLIDGEAVEDLVCDAEPVVVTVPADERDPLGEPEDERVPGAPLLGLAEPVGE